MKYIKNKKFLLILRHTIHELIKLILTFQVIVSSLTLLMYILINAFNVTLQQASLFSNSLLVMTLLVKIIQYVLKVIKSKNNIINERLRLFIYLMYYLFASYVLIQLSYNDYLNMFSFTTIHYMYFTSILIYFIVKKINEFVRFKFYSTRVLNLNDSQLLNDLKNDNFLNVSINEIIKKAQEDTIKLDYLNVITLDTIDIHQSIENNNTTINFNYCMYIDMLKINLFNYSIETNYD